MVVQVKSPLGFMFFNPFHHRPVSMSIAGGSAVNTRNFVYCVGSESGRRCGLRLSE